MENDNGAEAQCSNSQELGASLASLLPENLFWQTEGKREGRHRSV